MKNNVLETYYANPAISQSQLKKLLLGPIFFKKEEESNMFFKEYEHFNIGSAVDTLITQWDSFDTKFYVSRLSKKPSDSIKSIIQEVYHNVKNNKSVENLIQKYPTDIITACDNHEYCMNFKEQTRINKIVEWQEYWEELINSEGKVILSQEEYDTITSIVMSLRSNEFTSDYFKEDIRNKEIIYQLPIYFTYLDVNCKALLDMVIIDHHNKTIQPIDIKTIGDYTSNFHKNFMRNKYYLQSAFYTLALQNWIAENAFKEFTILPFKFIVESTIQQGEPRVFTVTEDLLYIGIKGRIPLYTPSSMYVHKIKYNTLSTNYVARSRLVKGINDLLLEYKYYMNVGWEKEKEYLESKGHFEIDWLGVQ